jgi:hypothetical protein
VSALFRESVGRVLNAPAVVVVAWLATMVFAFPLTVVVREAIADQLGASLQAEVLAAGADYDWLQEFNAGATGAAASLGARVIGFAAVLDNISGLLDRQARPVALVAAYALFAAAWAFLAGGIIDRLARDRRTWSHGFFSACGRMFPRLARLAVANALVYGMIFGSLHPWLFDGMFAILTRNTTAERSAFLVLIGLYAVFLAALGTANIVFDYARVRMVVEDRRSALGAIAAALRFLRRNGRAAVTLYLLDAALLLIVIAVYALVAPGAGGAGWTVWLAFAISQAYIIARVAAKLVFWSSATVLFQHRLAHAGYVARRAPAWPESPIVERM